MAIIPTTIRLPDGSLGTVNFDTVTGQQVGTPTQTNKIQTNDAFTSDLDELGLSPTPETPEAPKPTVAQEVKKAPVDRSNGGDRAQEAGQGGPSTQQAGLANFGRSATNNYGYINRPGALGFASMLPGAAGMAAKAVNAGISANNTAATNKAREQLGLDKVSFGRALGNMFSDQKGQVADVKVGQNQYSVGLEALDKTGRTTLTPTEAAARAASNATSLIEATPAESKAARAEFTEEHGSWLDRARTAVGDIFSSIFSGDDDEVTTQTEAALNEQGLKAAREAGPTGDVDKFPDRPSSPGGNSDKGWGDMSQSERDRAESMSGEVSDSIREGKGGLY